MKLLSVVLLSLTCVLGLVVVSEGVGYGQQVQYVPYYGGYGGGRYNNNSGWLLGLIGLLFLLTILFSGNLFNTTSSNTGSNVVSLG